MLQKLQKTDYVISAWSGGTTTQLAIFPPDAVYAERDFLWRVSSATVELEESEFTPLPAYERLISTLEGGIELSHNGGPTLTLRPFEVHAFSGADATHSRGRCTDFNLMLRRDRVTGSMEPLRLTEAPVSAHGLRCAASETLLLFCVSGRCFAEAAICHDACARPLSEAEPPDAAPRAGAAIGRPPEVEAPRDGHPERSDSGAEGSVSLASGETLLLTGPALLTLSGEATLMLCRIRLCR